MSIINSMSILDLETGLQKTFILPHPYVLTPFEGAVAGL